MRGRSPPLRPPFTDSMKTGKSSGRKWARSSCLHLHAQLVQLDDDLVEALHLRPAHLIISIAGSCRWGRSVPVHSSTTMGLKSRKLASFDVAATHWFVSTPPMRTVSAWSALRTVSSFVLKKADRRLFSTSQSSSAHLGARRRARSPTYRAATRRP